MGLLLLFLLFAAAAAMLSAFMPAAAAAGPGEFSAPADVVMLFDGTVYVADTGNDRIQVFWPNGTFSFEFGSPGDGPGEFSAPAGIFMSDERRTLYGVYPAQLYVADTGNDRIQVFWPNGTFVRLFGSSGSGDGQFDGPGDVYVDWDSMIGVADTGNDRIQLFWYNGTFAHSFGSHGSGDGQFDGPQSLVIVPWLGYTIYVADTGNDRVQSFRYAWDNINQVFRTPYFRTHGSNGTADGQFDGLRSVDTGGFNDADLIVADTGNDRVQRVTGNGHFVNKFGAGGTGNGNFSAPAGVDMTVTGAFAVADTGNDRVQVFWPNGTLRFDLGPPPPDRATPPPPPDRATPPPPDRAIGYRFAFEVGGSYGSGPGEFRWPDSVAIGPNGILAVADVGNHRVQVFNPNGTFAFEIGSRGHGTGEFFYPADVAIGPSGILAVADVGNHRVQVFNPNGTFAFEIGSRGHGTGEFFYPADVAIGPSGILAVADVGNHRVQFFYPE